jgi:hypothetical protein
VVGALLASAFATAALAEKSDRAFIEEMRGQIATARSEPGVARQGASELAEAERRLPELAKALDDNEAEDARASRDGIKALIQAARIRAQVTSTPETRPASYSRPAPMPAKKTIHRVAYKHAQPTKGCTLASR